ncbi:hypothetical protein [Clostridium botulinum]|uniref:Uncharacterized protein n=1 Tax=Clostridium botulinum (strain Langeland / NCTC 10281 / Type F) TaxID=441772 RepID=A7GBJ2_CLOBL|nr:hypothetical protein [Clostridium botulinum]ABS40570.1 hypothetical protein CLI_0880 [Clostridium botulinum F str. Langeland]ADF98620.1 hypothetical protein CBF_0851 [Clostridium botulinum F str. 230613]KKM40096.1 hypothetical protein VT72_17525 [Clostridium botulinum]MBY6791886.1 hypothetical protein [Clostridium botulinum]MBY6935893.1 hypothetical protein [Clostridium botulinum]
MEEALKYLRELQSKYSNMKFADLKDVLDYRRLQLDLSEDDSNRILKLLNNDNKLECWEDWYKKNIIQPFIKALPTEISLKLQKICFGLLPTYRANASALRSPNGDSIVIIHTQLFAIIHQYNESQFILGKLTSNLEYFMNSCKEIVKCFKYYKFLPKLSVLPAVLNAEELIISILKTCIQELFIILHEFAHIYLGHKATTKSTNLFCLDGNTSVEEFVRTQKMELEADLQAIGWIIEVSKSQKLADNPIFRYLNIQPYFALEVFMLFHLLDINLGKYDEHMDNEPESVGMRIVDIAKELDDLVSDDKVNNKSTHPKASVRFLHLVVEMLDKFNGEGQKFLQEMLINMVYFETFKVELD